MMRKTLACCCLAVSVIIGIYLDRVAFLIVRRLIDSKLALLIFVPVFIIMFWFGTFYDQLTIKDGKAIFGKTLSRVLRAVYIVNMLSVCAVWLWVIYRYTYFFGDLIGTVKGFFG